VALFVDGQINGLGIIVSILFHKIYDGGGTRQMCMVKIWNVEPTLENAELVRMGTGVKLSKFLGM
jgi:hypothetical protein